MTEDQAGQLIKRILGAFPTQRQKMSAADVAGMVISYTAGLVDLDFDAARAAVDRANRTSEFIPTIAKIRAELGELAHGQRRPGIDAWGDVVSMRTYRDREALETFDPLSVEICQRFGWIEWRTLWRGGRDVDQWHVVTADGEAADRADRARFAEAYDKLAGAASKEIQAQPGAASLPAAEAGDQARRLIGDVAKKLGGGGR